MQLVPLSLVRTFNGGPPSFDLPLGTAGQVLTSNGAGKAPTFQAGAGIIPDYFAVALAAGATNNLNPGIGWPPSSGSRLDLDTSAGAATVTGLVAANDGIIVLIRNTGANTLTLASANAGSSAANQFLFVADLELAQYGSAWAVYYGQGIDRWILE